MFNITLGKYCESKELETPQSQVTRGLTKDTLLTNSRRFKRRNGKTHQLTPIDQVENEALNINLN